MNTAPTAETPDLIKTQKEFSDILTQDLTDSEIQRAFEIMIPIIQKWQERFRSKSMSPFFDVEDALKLVSNFEDEIKTELAEKLNLLVSVDVTPLFNGEPPVIEFHGALPSHDVAKYGFDHEKKTYEVTKAAQRDEDYLGQKGPVRKRKK